MILELAGLAFGYGAADTISNITFRADPGEIVSILGPNGVGKTTLLKCINRIQHLRDGTVAVNGDNLADLEPRAVAQRVGYVPQRMHLSESTVFESVLIGRRPRLEGSLNQADLRIAGHAVTLLGLEPLAAKRVDEISGGEYQLVQIARALAQHPRVILLDEPTSNLDLSNQHRVMETLTHIVRENGICAVMTNHDLNLAIRYSDRFILMSKGRIFAAGGREVITPENIEAVYGTKVYVGAVNGIPVVVPQ